MTKEVMKQALGSFLDSQDFYELMQAYRHTQMDAAKEFEAVRLALFAAIAQQIQPAIAKSDFSELEKAARDAAESLETIYRLAGRETYGSPPIETYMETFHNVRMYAKSRSTAAKDEIESAIKTIAQPVQPTKN